MQNARDSFYIALRNRLAALNPGRTVRVRGVQRPSLLVEDAEALTVEPMEDVFVLRWTAATAMELMPTPLIGLGCELHYGTSGTQGAAGLDRGRALSEMDREVLAILQPLWTPKLSYRASPPATMGTNLFWTEPELGGAVTDRNALRRIAKVTVYAFEEPGE